MFEKIGRQFFLWRTWGAILKQPREILVEVVCFLVVGSPVVWGFFRYEVLKLGPLSVISVPSSSLGVVLRSGADALGSTMVREDGTPVFYEEGTVEVEKVGTGLGLTLRDVEEAQETQESD